MRQDIIASYTVLLICLSNCVIHGGCRLARGEVSPDAIADDLSKPAKVVADLASMPQPSQRRNWRPELAVLPFAEFDGPNVTVRHVRQCRWRSDTDYDVKHADWKFSLADVQSVDFIVVPFPATPMLAHTMLSFGLSDGRHLALSVEARLEAHESYSAVAGAARQYDLIYILADETDLLGLRAEVRRDDIYLYKTIATSDQAATMLKNILERANSLRENPEFYDSIRNSCATNVADHIEQISPRKTKGRLAIAASRTQ